MRRHAARATFPLQQRGLSSDCFVNTLDYEPLLGKTYFFIDYIL